MGYFSNGCEGMDYQEHYCSRCIHDVKNDLMDISEFIQDL